MKKTIELRIIAALLTIIVTFFVTGTYAEASVLEYRKNICASTQEDEYFIIKCSSTNVKKGGTINFYCDCSEGLKGAYIVWKVDDGNIAEISNGRLTATRAGLVEVTAICGRFSSSCYINVLE